MASEPGKQHEGFCLLDLAFLIFDMLLGHRIIFAEDKLFRVVARVLLGHIKVAGVRSRIEADLDGCGLRHGLAFKKAPETQLAARKI